MAKNLVTEAKRGRGRPRNDEATPPIGHNGGGIIDREALAAYVEQIETVEDSRRLLSEDLKEIYEKAKNAGFVTKLLRQIVRERRMDSDVRMDHLRLMDAYRSALGMLADTPLGEAAMATAHPPSNLVELR